MSNLELPRRVSGARPVLQLPAHLQCSSCSKPLFNACMTPHGCRLCQLCVTDLLPPVEKRRCPGNTEACRDLSEEIDVSQATCFPDMATRRDVAKLPVRCPNCDSGCSVQLAWALMDRHVQDSCDFCTLGCELCDQQIMKKDMQRHTSRECRQRKETCDLCSQLVTVSEMETRHRNLESDVCCPRFSAPCPHCGNRRKKLDRRNYMAHLSECPEKPVDCKYSHLGCTAKIRRSDVEKHYREDSDAHVTLLDKKLRQIGAASPASQPQIAALPSRTQEFSELKRQTECLNEAFKKMQINVANWTHTMLEFEQVADRFGGVSQMRDSLQSYSDRADQLQSRGPARGNARFDRDASPTSSAVPPTQDTLQPHLQQQLAKLETRLVNLEFTSYDGSLTWRVADLAAKRRETLTPVFSVPFFLRRFGPAFRIQLYLNGWESGYGSHLSVYVVHVASQLDHPLDWPIIGDATVRLINLKDRQQDFVKTLAIETAGGKRPSVAPDDFLVCCGEPKLATLAEFNDRCVRKDSCFLQVKIKERRSDSGVRQRRTERKT